MKRLFWLSQLYFTGSALAFFVGLHLANMFLLGYSDNLLMGGLVIFVIGLIPMWVGTVLGIGTIRRNRNSQNNWLEQMFVELPRPELISRSFKFLWLYFIGFFGLALVLSNFHEEWTRYLASVGLGGIFIGFYGIGFICAWANLRKCSSAQNAASSSQQR